jgi:hypothetical protein
MMADENGRPCIDGSIDLVHLEVPCVGLSRATAHEQGLCNGLYFAYNCIIVVPSLLCCTAAGAAASFVDLK